MSGLSMVQRDALRRNLVRWARALKRSAEEHGRPNTFGVVELVGEFHLVRRTGYYLGQIRLAELRETLAILGADWASSLEYKRGRFSVGVLPGEEFGTRGGQR